MTATFPVRPHVSPSVPTSRMSANARGCEFEGGRRVPASSPRSVLSSRACSRGLVALAASLAAGGSRARGPLGEPVAPRGLSEDRGPPRRRRVGRALARSRRVVPEHRDPLRAGASRPVRSGRAERRGGLDDPQPRPRRHDGRGGRGPLRAGRLGLPGAGASTADRRRAGEDRASPGLADAGRGHARARGLPRRRAGAGRAELQGADRAGQVGPGTPVGPARLDPADAREGIRLGRPGGHRQADRTQAPGEPARYGNVARQLPAVLGAQGADVAPEADHRCPGDARLPDDPAESRGGTARSLSEAGRPLRRRAPRTAASSSTPIARDASRGSSSGPR